MNAENEKINHFKYNNHYIFYNFVFGLMKSGLKSIFKIISAVASSF